MKDIDVVLEKNIALVLCQRYNQKPNMTVEFKHGLFHKRSSDRRLSL